MGGMAALFEETEDLRLTASARTVDELLAEDPQLDLVLLDLSLADKSMPEENVAKLSARGIPALAFTSGDNAYLIRSAARGGGVIGGVVRKSQEPEILLAAIRGALREDADLLSGGNGRRPSTATRSSTRSVCRSGSGRSWNCSPAASRPSGSPIAPACR